MIPKKITRTFLRRTMDISSMIMIGAASILLVTVYLKSPDSAAKGLHSSAALIVAIAPRMLAAFVIAGLIQAVIPEEVIVRWMGKGSGLKGISIGMIIGSLTPGGPMTHFPVVATLFKMGVGIGPLVSYLTAWGLFGLQRIIMWELPFLGARVVMIRLLASILFPLLAGVISHFLWEKLHL
jgi:uncharacterized membrane protein YraQ (UPF0718 family)